MGLAAGSSLIAAVPVRAQEFHHITPARVEGLCPGAGLPGTLLGEPRARQDRGLVNALGKLPAHFAPFTEAELDLTDWSDQLAGITWRAASPDGAVNDRTMAAFRAAMTAAGWTETVQGDLMSPLGFNAIMFEKDLLTNLGQRRMLVEFDTPGALMLRCADAALLELALAERDGKLAPGSPRPPMPALDPAVTLPGDGVCADPQLQAVFADADYIDESSPALQQLMAFGTRAGEVSRAGNRLNTWLKWKLTGSGRITPDALWALEEQVSAHNGEELSEELTGFLEAAGGVMQARKARDHQNTCRAFLTLMGHQHKRHLRQIARWTAINAALEAEAVRLGVALD